MHQTLEKIGSYSDIRSVHENFDSIGVDLLKNISCSLANP